MKRILWIVFALIVLAGCIVWRLTAPTTLADKDLPDHTIDLANGELLFHAGGCASCHAAPDAEGRSKYVLTGGLALTTEFGTFVAPNISTDPTVGIGGWSDLDFVNAMKRGVSPEGQHYYPVFPYASYQRMPVTDLLDLHAYLKTLPATDQGSEPHTLRFPYNIRRTLGVWKFLHIDGRTFVPNPNTDEKRNRGAYLVVGPAHCGECHTPRDGLGGMLRDRWLAGAPEAEGNGFVPNITPHETGIGDWSASDIAYALESGFDPEFDSFGGSMVAVQENMAKLPASDREAIAAYLLSIPALPETMRPARE